MISKFKPFLRNYVVNFTNLDFYFMYKIKKLHARQIINSRGNPTIEVDVTLQNNILGRAAVPSGASTGKHEALELLDGDKQFYRGKGVLNAISKINNEIFHSLKNLEFSSYNQFDLHLINLDSTPNKSRLGANAILGCSLAFVDAVSKSKNIYLFELLDEKRSKQFLMPTPMMNVINGGEHANNALDIQEIMLLPISANSFSQSMQIGCEVFQELKTLLNNKGLSTNVGDEGGFAPDFKSNFSAIDILIESIEKAGYIPGKEICLALDVAATELYDKHEQKYYLQSEKRFLSSAQMIQYYINLCKTYPILSIEDGLSEDDWSGWSHLHQELGSHVQIVGDDLTVTNIHRIQQAKEKNAINSVLIKLNQIGTVSETIAAIKLTHSYNMSSVISHRSGETEDTKIADLAVAMRAGQIKTGSLCRTDRVAKYNQLLRIEEYLGHKAFYTNSLINEKSILFK